MPPSKEQGKNLRFRVQVKTDVIVKTSKAHGSKSFSLQSLNASLGGLLVAKDPQGLFTPKSGILLETYVLPEGKNNPENYIFFIGEIAQVHNDGNFGLKVREIDDANKIGMQKFVMRIAKEDPGSLI